MALRKFGGKNFSTKDGEKVGGADLDDQFVTADGKLKAGSNPWNASASGHSYQGERWDDDTGYKRGEQSRAGDQAWQSRGADDAEFLRPSQTKTDHGDGRDSVESIYGDVMAEQGQGPYGAGGSAVRQVGGGSGPPRFKPKSSKQAQDDQSNDGL